MPLLGMLQLLVGIGFALHAYNTGRAPFWMFILIFVPVIGALAYIAFELLPEWANSRRARQISSDIRTVVDPHRDWRRLNENAAVSDTVEAKSKLAEECERKGMWADAVRLYHEAAQGMFADDPDVLRKLARAQVGAGDGIAAEHTLNRLRSAHPNYQSADAHLTYARALEAQGRIQEADAEYRSLCGYSTSFEARTRYALLQQKLGEPVNARRLFEDVVRASKVRGVVLTADDREWIRVALRNSAA